MKVKAMNTLPLSRRLFTLGLGAVAGASALGLPRVARASTDLSGVVLRVADQTAVTKSKFEAAGLLKDLPYQIEWSIYPAAVNLHEALKAGAADIGSSSDAPAVSAVAGGSKVKFVAAWANGGRGTSIIVPKGSTVQSLADLRGKVLSPTTRGSVGHFLVIRALEQAGISEDELKLAFLAPTDAAAAFQSGDIDAWSTWTIYVARAEGRLGARSLLSAEGLLSGLGVYAATETALEDAGKVAAMRDFLQRVQLGHTWTKEQPEAWIDYYAGFTRQDRDIAAGIHPSEAAYEPVAVDAALGAELQRTFETWKKAGVLSGDINFADKIFPGVLA